MKLAALFEEKNVLIHMDVGSYKEAIEALVGSLADKLGSLKPEAICERILDVENSIQEAPGHGVRIPHARLGGLKRTLLAVGTSREGIEMGSESGERANLIFLILTPRTESTAMLQIMSSIARLVGVKENRKALISTTAPARLLRFLEESGIQVKKAIVAADLMNAPEHSVGPETVLRQVTQVLANCREEGIPVVGGDNELLGDISTRSVIEVGLPKYMNLITDSKVLSEFEPFEAFFKKEETLTASEVMNAEPLRLAPETPVEIVAHEMLTTKSERAYIVEEKRLLGVVYRKDIVRKVLNL